MKMIATSMIAIATLVGGRCSRHISHVEPVPTTTTVDHGAEIPDPAPPGVTPGGWSDPVTGQPLFPPVSYPPSVPCDPANYDLAICGPATFDSTPPPRLP